LKQLEPWAGFRLCLPPLVFPAVKRSSQGQNLLVTGSGKAAILAMISEAQKPFLHILKQHKYAQHLEK